MTATPFLMFPANDRFLLTGTGTPQYGQGNLPNGCVMLFLTPFIGVAIFLIAMVVNQFYEGFMLSTSGVATTGQVTDLNVYEDEGSYTYAVTYLYVVADRTYTRRQNVSETRYQSYQIGQAISLTYAGQAPNVATITGVENGAMDWFLIPFTVLWVLVISVFISIFYLAWRRFERLKRDGKLIYGEVVEFRGEKDSDGDYQITITARFRSPNTQQWVQGKRYYTCNHHISTHAPAAGTPVAIYYADDTVWETL